MPLETAIGELHSFAALGQHLRREPSTCRGSLRPADHVLDSSISNGCSLSSSRSPARSRDRFSDKPRGVKDEAREKRFFIDKR